MNNFIFEEFAYASPSKRLAAAFLDFLILVFLNLFIIFLLIFAAGASGLPDDYRDLAGFLTVLLYFSGFESSAFRATPGKLFFGIKVANLKGGRISFLRAVGRYFGKILSAFTLGIGYLMIFFTSKNQGMYDLISKCIVIDIRK